MLQISPLSPSFVSSKPRLRCRASGVGPLLGVAGIVGMTVFCSMVSSPSARAQSLQPGEILLNDLGGNDIDRFSASGTLEQTYTASGAVGSEWTGASITPDGNIVTAFRTPSKGIAIFRPDGSLLTSFLTPGVMSFANDVSVFADGTIAINDRDKGSVRLYSQMGNFQGSLTASGLANSFGSTVGTDNTLWVTDGTDRRLFHFTESGTLLNNFSLAFAPGDVVVDPTNGSLWLSDFLDDNIVHLNSTTGTLLGSFNTGMNGDLFGLGISPDGKTLYATTDSSTVIQEFDTTGLTTGSITVSNANTPIFLTVVPSASSISASAPEPGSIALLMTAGLPLIGMVGKRRNR